MGGLGNHIGRLRVWAATGALAVTAMVAGSASPVSAANAFRGYTWYHDGAIYKEAPSGTAVSVFATAANPNTSFKLRIAPAEQEETCPDPGATDLNANVRYSNSRGFIATTAGVANRTPGEYEICFYQIPLGPTGQRYATLPVFLALL